MYFGILPKVPKVGNARKGFREMYFVSLSETERQLRKVQQRSRHL
jgi:hypothetical protein